ncbi:hypothetical protein [Demequina sp. SO4-18]|uniref:hypothetical protein n=1 Tax=Demequina sp. SO4-18 TaxID=3401026 RepID=UPI003B5CFCE2
MTDNVHGKSERPSAAIIQHHIDEVIKLYPAAIDLATGQAASGALEDYTTGGGVHDLSDIVNVALSRILDEIDSDVRSYARMLDDAGRTGVTGHSVVALVKWLRIHIGFFTHGDDAQVAYEFESDVEKWHNTLEMAADPGGRVSIDTGEKCQEDCEGFYRITIDRDKEVPYDLALDHLRGKDARCSINPQHTILVEMLPMVRRWVATHK